MASGHALLTRRGVLIEPHAEELHLRANDRTIEATFSLLVAGLPGSHVFLARPTSLGGFSLDPLSFHPDTVTLFGSLLPPTLSRFTVTPDGDPPWELPVPAHVPHVPVTDLRVEVMPIGPVTAPLALVGLVTPLPRAVIAGPLHDAAHILTAWIAPPPSVPPRAAAGEPALATPASVRGAGGWLAHDAQRILDLLPEQVFIKDRELRFQFVNQQLVKDLGYASSADIIGLTDDQLFSPALATEFAAAERKLIATGEPIIGVLENQQLPGDPDRWRRTDKYPLRDEAGNIVGLVGSSWDVTAWRAAEEAIRPLAALVEWSNDAIIGIGLDERVTHWNRGAERLFQYTSAEIVGQPYRNLVPSGSPMVPIRDLLSEVSNQFAPAIETLRLRRDGSRLEVEAKAALVRDDDGQPAGISVVLRDISQRKQAESRLRELERRHRTFIERMPAVTYIVAARDDGAQGAYLHFGDRAEDEFGYDTQNWFEDAGFTFKITHPDDAERVIRDAAIADDSGDPFSADYRIVSARGETRWVRDEAILIRDDDTAVPQYWLGFMVDITDQKRAEVDITLANTDLRQANDELKRVSTVKSEIISAISHEFRTPLTSIQGYSELLLDEELEPEVARLFATTINTNARRLARMISDMLDLDRLDSGHVTVRALPVDINETVEMVVDLLRPTSPSHTFVLDLAPVRLMVSGDADLIARLITNLVANAIKYSPNGGAVIVRTETDDASATLSVHDEGLGIPEDALERIFDRYARLDRPEQASIEGNGLGLPIARQIVELHRGRIWAESQAGTPGATFFVELPVVSLGRNEGAGG